MTQRPSPGAGEQAPSAADFDPVPVRCRRDGWTPERQRAFIGELVRHHKVGRAARSVGMSRESAYRLRDRPDAGSFAAAWNKALASRPPQGVTASALLWHRAFYGVTRPIVRGGKEVGTVTKPDNRALLKLYDRVDRLVRNGERRERSPPPACRRSLP